MKFSSPPLTVRLVALALGLAVAAYVALRMVRTASDSGKLRLTETHRTNLVFQAGRWQLPGTTNFFTGLLLDTYEDGARKSLSVVSNGFLEGISRGWHTNGQQQVEEHFILGISHGIRTKWYPNGQKLSEVNIVAGKLDGIFRRWDENGALTEEIEMKDGEPDGISKAYFSNGLLKAKATLRNGKVISRQSWNEPGS